MIDWISKNHVSIQTAIGDENHRTAYVNSADGRKELRSEHPEEWGEVAAVWGEFPTWTDAPTVLPHPMASGKFALPTNGCAGDASYTVTSGGVGIEADVTTAYHIGTLPTGYCPTADRKVQATCPGGIGVIVLVCADGTVRLEAPQVNPMRVVFRDTFILDS